MQPCVPGRLTFTPVLQVHFSLDLELLYFYSLTGVSEAIISFRNTGIAIGVLIEMDGLGKYRCGSNPGSLKQNYACSCKGILVLVDTRRAVPTNSKIS